ncbi:hypothetical protein EZV62_013097 [Acer yangbiense]|uniref:TF-B3 domain-containing protein n=1 Tax=Acer yangbiense TaxID=1000413 RepID=A0A5C7HY15_9ROSI|nr:hypothetical protein EZV62_013097 [Acer yangbiense]
MEETPQHFFKVINASTLQDKKLRIPKKFVRKFEDELSAFATITTSDSRVWQVGLSKDGAKIWFHHGLQDFIEYYSICVGYFLVFKYEKRSKFHVIIFDTSTFEISYENLIHHDEIEKDEVYRNQKGSANLDSSRPRHEREMPSRNRKMKEPVQVQTDTADNGEDEILFVCNLYRKYKFSSAKERDRLFTLARSLKFINPSFVIVLRQSHLHSHTVCLPAKFTNRYMTQDAESIKIRAFNGREWLVRISWKDGCHVLQGWSKFLNDMKIKVGDICVFELIRSQDWLLEVSVFKET